MTLQAHDKNKSYISTLVLLLFVIIIIWLGNLLVCQGGEKLTSNCDP